MMKVDGKAAICRICNQPITGNMISAENAFFHPECFVCAGCGKRISGGYAFDGNQFFHSSCYRQAKGMVCDYCGKIFDGDRWLKYGEKKYHETCFEDHIRPRCAICGGKIYDQYTTDSSGIYHIICYKEHKVPKCCVCLAPLEGRTIVDCWGHHAHAEHNNKPTVVCDSCSRIIAEDTSKGGFQYADGRIVCGICRMSAIEKPADVENAKRHILSMLQSAGMSGFPDRIEIYLVGNKELHDLAKADKDVRMRGYTQFAAVQRPFGWIKSHIVHILYGLPQMEFEGVLAHELLHVWVNENNIVFEQGNVEGFCNLGSMQVYQQDDSPFARILLKNMEENPDPVYGIGYRHMRRKLHRLGWENFIAELKKD